MASDDNRPALTRRQMLTGSLAGGAAIAGSAALVSGALDYYLPPSIGNIKGLSESLGYASSRIVQSHANLVPEYPQSAITMLDDWKKDVPADPALLPHITTKFEHWRLPVTGRVRRPASFSLADLGQMQRKTQIIARHCITGYSSIAPYTGVPLRALLEIVGLATDVRYIGFQSYFDGGWDSIDLFDAFHPQTLLSYEEMPGTRISFTRGAPLRLTAPLHYGYKWIKGIRSIVVLENLDDFGDGTGMGSSYAAKGRTWAASAS